MGEAVVNLLLHSLLAREVQRLGDLGFKISPAVEGPTAGGHIVQRIGGGRGSGADRLAVQLRVAHRVHLHPIVMGGQGHCHRAAYFDHLGRGRRRGAVATEGIAQVGLRLFRHLLNDAIDAGHIDIGEAQAVFGGRQVGFQAGVGRAVSQGVVRLAVFVAVNYAMQSVLVESHGGGAAEQGHIERLVFGIGGALRGRDFADLHVFVLFDHGDVGDFAVAAGPLLQAARQALLRQGRQIQVGDQHHFRQQHLADLVTGVAAFEVEHFRGLILRDREHRQRDVVAQESRGLIHGSGRGSGSRGRVEAALHRRG